MLASNPAGKELLSCISREFQEYGFASSGRETVPGPRHGPFPHGCLTIIEGWSKYLSLFCLCRSGEGVTAGIRYGKNAVVHICASRS